MTLPYPKTRGIQNHKIRPFVDPQEAPPLSAPIASKKGGIKMPKKTSTRKKGPVFYHPKNTPHHKEGY
jgi:hypothetical protein